MRKFLKQPYKFIIPMNLHQSLTEKNILYSHSVFVWFAKYINWTDSLLISNGNLLLKYTLFVACLKLKQIPMESWEKNLVSENKWHLNSVK